MRAIDEAAYGSRFPDPFCRMIESVRCERATERTLDSAALSSRHLRETSFAHHAQVALNEHLARTNYSTGKFYAICITQTQPSADKSPQSALDSGTTEPSILAQ